MAKRKIVMEYLYRDAANNKLYEESSIENPNIWDMEIFEKCFQCKLIVGLFLFHMILD